MSGGGAGRSGGRGRPLGGGGTGAERGGGKRAELLVLGAAGAVLVALCAYGASTERRIGVPSPPFAMRSDPSISWWAALAALVLAAAVAGAQRLERVRFAPVVLFAVALLVRLAVNAARGDGLDAWTRTYDLGSFEGPLEYVAGLDALVYGAGFFLDRYAELAPALPTHVAGHPPGLVLLMHWLGLDTPGRLAALTIAAGALVAPAVYALARSLELEERVARSAGALAALAPGPVLIGATSADALYATLGVGTAALLVARRPALQAAGAVALPLAAFFNWALLAVGAFAVLVVAARERAAPEADAPRGSGRSAAREAGASGPWWHHAGQLRRALALAAGCAVALLAFHGALALATGWDPIGALRSTHQAYTLGIARGRPYGYWLLGSPAAAFAFGGLVVGGGWLVAAARRQPAALALAAVVAFAALLGFSKAETERIWLFLVAIACVPAAAVLPPRLLTPALAACAVQALAVELLYDTVW